MNITSQRKQLREHVIVVKKSVKDNAPTAKVSSPRKVNCSRNTQIPKISNALSKISSKRSIIPMLASVMNIPKSILHNVLKRGNIVCRKNSFKLLLTNQNTFYRMIFTLLFIRIIPHKNKSVFDNMRNVVDFGKMVLPQKRDPTNIPWSRRSHV